MRRLTVVAVGFVAAAAAAMPGWAADGAIDWEGYGAFGISLLPDYDGSKDYEGLPYIEARLNTGNYYAWIDGNDLRFNLIDDGHFHAGPTIGIRRGRQVVDNAAISRLPHFDDMMSTGAFVEYENIHDDPRAGERVTLIADDGVINVSGGWVVTLRGEIHRPLDFIDPGFIVSLEADANWADRDYMRTYYGVTPAASAASGLPAFDPSSGFDSVGAALSFDQFLSRHWDVGMRFHYARLTGGAAASPVTALVGSADQYFLALVAGYAL
ncbi:MAG: MipA/OmpV family protein [Alphaproteobacteria bacterium]|nr:MipA/OmpV family protein [Alphaproteobacteria bacterium]MDE2110067.1 MipA/OmpV family protein [Alphaproteobacteria bacterium]MDE2492998.1 MipA/OmpV family protein [Alphaproteobacteria bacterium]